MKSKKRHVSPVAALFLLFLIDTISMNILALPCSGANSELQGTVFSLTVEDEPLGEALKKISNSTGYEITVSENWEGLPVTAQFEDVTVEVALKRVLKGLSHSLVIENMEKRISIKIVNRSPNIQASEQLALPNSSQTQLDPGDIEVIPPEKPGEKGLTQRELDAIIAAQEKIDPGDIEVAPPEKPGERGLTQRELDAIIAAQENKTPDTEPNSLKGFK